jgi:hypothetical protein
MYNGNFNAQVEQDIKNVMRTDVERRINSHIENLLHLCIRSG